MSSFNPFPPNRKTPKSNNKNFQWNLKQRLLLEMLEDRIVPAPMAVDDPAVFPDPAFTTDEDTAIVGGPSLLTNDSSTTNDPIEIIGFDSQSANSASVTVDLVTGAFDYDPSGVLDSLNEGEAFTDTFTYTIQEGMPPNVPLNLLTNGDFSAAGTTIGDTTQDIENFGPADTWLLTDDGGGGGGDQWRISGDALVLNQNASTEAQAAMNRLVDNKATTGPGILEFDLDWDQNGSGNTGEIDLRIYVYGWDGDDPRIDSQNGNVGAGDEFNIEGATRLDGETGDNPFVIINNNSTSIPGLTEGDGFETVSIPIDFMGGFDNIGLAFYGEARGGASFVIDNVGFFGLPPGTTDTATVSIQVIGVNDAPDADNDTNSITELANDTVSNNDVSGNLFSNDTDVDDGSGSFSVTQISNSASGTDMSGTIVGDYGTLTWTPNTQGNGNYTYELDDANSTVQALLPGQTLTDTFTYTMSDNHSGGNAMTDTATLTITINGVNDSPNAVDDTADVKEDVTLSDSGNLVTNDDDPDHAGSSLTVTDIEGETDPNNNVNGSFGTLDWDTDGSFTYNLDNGNNAVQALGEGEMLMDMFMYTVSDPFVTGDGLFNIIAFQETGGGGDTQLNNTDETLGIWDQIDLGNGPVQDGTIGNIAANGTNYNIQIEIDTETRVNYDGGGDFTGGNGNPDLGGASINNNGPGGSGGTVPGGAGGADDYSIRGQTYMAFNVGGTYSIAALSDDGRRLELTDVTPGGSSSFTGFTAHGGQINSGSGTGTNFLQMNGTTGHNESIGVFTVNAGDILFLDAFFFERGGGNDFELAIKPGSDTGFGGVGDGWRLIEDGVFGISIDSTNNFSQSGSLGKLTVNIEGTNDTPTANANGPYTTDPGQDFMVSAAGSSDPDTNDNLEYAWDFDQDGTPETAFSSLVMQTIPWQATQNMSGGGSLGLGVHNIDLIVRDDSGTLNNTDTDTTTLTVSSTFTFDADPSFLDYTMDVDNNILRIYETGNVGNILSSVDYTGITDVIINGSDAGADTLRIDYGGTDNPVPSGGVDFDGGDPTSAPGDRLFLNNGNFGVVTHNMTNGSSGTIDITGTDSGTITYTGLEPVDMTGSTAIDFMFNLPAGADNAQLSDIGGGDLRLESTDSPATFESTAFTPPTNGSITINGGPGDTLTISNALSFASDLIVNVPTININGGGVETTAGANGGDQIYNGTVFIGTDTTLNGNDVNFTSTVDGGTGLVGLPDIAHDGFEDYGVGAQLETGSVGLNGGTGWTGDYDVAGGARQTEVTVIGTGLNYTNGSITIDGGNRAMQYAATEAGIVELVSREIPAQSGTVYLSFLYNNTVDAGSVGASSNDFMQLGFDTGTLTNPRVSAMDRNTEFQVRSTTSASNSVGTGITSNAGQTYLVVLKAEKTSGSTYNRISVFIDPASTTEPAADAVSTTNSGLDLSANAFFNLRKASQENGDTYVFDELRIGTTFEEVTQSLGVMSATPNLTVNTNSGGTTTFGGEVGGTAPLASVTTNSDGDTQIGGDITTTGGTMTFDDSVVLNTDVTLNDSGATGVFFNGTVDSDSNGTPRSLTVNTPGNGTTAFNGDVGGTNPLSSVTTDAAGQTEIGGNITTVGGTQTYGDPVEVTNTVTLTDTGSTGIIFEDTVSDGGNMLQLTVDVQAGAVADFQDSVQDTISLVNAGPGTLILGPVVHTFDGTVDVNDGTMDVQGNLTATGGDITLGDGVSLVSTNGSGTIEDRMVVVPGGSAGVQINDLAQITKNGGTAVDVAGEATLDGNIIEDSSTGVMVTGTATLIANVVQNNDTGVHLNNGSLTLSRAGGGNQIINDVNSLDGLLLQGDMSELSDGVQPGNNHLGNTLFEVPSLPGGPAGGGNYIRLIDGAFFGFGEPELVDASEATFQDVNSGFSEVGSNLMGQERDDVEDRVFHFLDLDSVGLVLYRTDVAFVDDGELVVFGSNRNNRVSINAEDPANVTVHFGASLQTDETTNEQFFDLTQGPNPPLITVFTFGGDDDVRITSDISARVFAGDDNDDIRTGGGDDFISGGNGRDRLRSGKGNDIVVGGLGRDVIFSEDGDDLIVAGATPLGPDELTALTIANEPDADAALEAIAMTVIDPDTRDNADRIESGRGRDRISLRLSGRGDRSDFDGSDDTQKDSPM